MLTIPLRSATTDSKTPNNYVRTSTPKAAWSHRYSAAKKKQTDRSRNRRRQEVPFITGCNHSTRKNNEQHKVSCSGFLPNTSSMQRSCSHHNAFSSVPFITTSIRHLPFLTTSLNHHFPSSPLPFVTAPQIHHLSKVTTLPSSPLPKVITLPSSSLPKVTTLPSSPLPKVTTLPSSPFLLVTTSQSPRSRSELSKSQSRQVLLTMSSWWTAESCQSDQVQTNATLQDQPSEPKQLSRNDLHATSACRSTVGPYFPGLHTPFAVSTSGWRPM